MLSTEGWLHVFLKEDSSNLELGKHPDLTNYVLWCSESLWINYKPILERVSNKRGKVMPCPNLLITAMIKARLSNAAFHKLGDLLNTNRI